MTKIENLKAIQAEIEKILLELPATPLHPDDPNSILVRRIPDNMEALYDTHKVIQVMLNKEEAHERLPHCIPRLSWEVIPRWGESVRWKDPKLRR